MRALALAVLTGVSISIAAPAALAEAVTTRIETRPFYGATVTLEEGLTRSVTFYRERAVEYLG